MKINFPVRLPVLVLAVALAVVASGCWPAHPHSTYLPIHQDAINGDAAGVAAELARHPDELNLPEEDGLTPLHLAAVHCQTNVLVLLLEKGANINVVAKDKATPLHLAAQEGCTVAVTLLLAHGANVNPRDDQNRTPLLRAKKWEQDDVVQLLKLHGGME